MGLLILLVAAALLLCLVGTMGLLYSLSHPPRTTYGTAIARGLPTDPGELGLDFEDTTLRLSDGTQTPAWVIRGELSGGPVVIVSHGWADGRFGAQLVAPLLAPYASRIVVYDMRGHGGSQARTSRCGLVEPDDLVAIIDQVLSDTPDRPVVLMGISMGVGVSIVAAVKAPGSIQRRVIGVIGDGGYRLWDEPIIGLFQLRRWPWWPLMPLAGAWMWLTNPTFRGFDRAAWAAKLQCPLLLLHGDEDPICPYASAALIVKAAPRGTLVTFPGGQHLDLAQRDPDRYADAIARFMNQMQEELAVE